MLTRNPANIEGAHEKGKERLAAVTTTTTRAILMKLMRQRAQRKCPRRQVSIAFGAAVLAARFSLAGIASGRARTCNAKMSLFRKLFGAGVAAPSDVARLDGTSEIALAHSLAALPPDGRGWISFAEARTLFSTKGDQYAFGETDNDGKRNIESFAAQHQCNINFTPLERRVYFIGSGGWRQSGIPPKAF